MDGARDQGIEAPILAPGHRLAQRLGGQDLDLGTTLNIPSGYPGAGSPVPERDLSPYINPIGLALTQMYPAPNFDDPDNRYNYAFKAGEQEAQQWLELKIGFGLD